ncbi:TetR/AcrR family transcriptional regulator [[Mycobacterium] fortunisiensis]|nr:TetR/AcrR family transcriptional regulator [[Mycobacterium] fortunisiensis]
MTSDSLPRARRRGPGRPAGSDAARTREHIMRAAFEVINDYGYAAATFQEIAKRAGLSRPTLNYYFAGRSELYATLLERAHEVVSACIGTAKQHEGTRVRLHAYIDAMVDTWQRDSAVVGFLVNVRLEEQRHPDLPAGTVAATREFLGDVVTEAIRRGELAADTDSAVLVDLLYSMVWGLGSHAVRQGCEVDLSAIAKQLHMVIDYGLLDGPGAGLCPAGKDTRGDTRGGVGGAQ